jgi:hypothetical protein
MIHSAAVRAILCGRVLYLEPREIPAETVSKAGGKVAVASRLCSAVRFLDRHVFKDRRLFQMSAAPGAVGSFEAQENVFQIEFLAVLKACLQMI